MGGEFLVPAIVFQRARQDGIIFFRGKLLKSPDAGFQLHLLGELGQVTFRLGRGQAPTLLHDRHVELKDAMGADPKRLSGIVIGDLEVIAKILLAAEFAGFDWVVVIDRTLGEGPFVERSRQGFAHRQGKNSVANPLRVSAHDGLPPLI
ncbi:hypothetical protein GALL_519750 [mine drainage metagenome]|uniref:Uncharacterized protein n=1 Tax=mine drainage metagenome TaxID=410659 RepID=A0A1J5PSB1_9ZZZZ